MQKAGIEGSSGCRGLYSRGVTATYFRNCGGVMQGPITRGYTTIHKHHKHHCCVVLRISVYFAFFLLNMLMSSNSERQHMY